MTGGTGFLGRRLVERLLAHGRGVTVLARRPAPDLAARGVKFVSCDLADPDKVRAACRGAATVFHLAAKVGVWGPYRPFYRANVLGARAIVDGCRAHGVPRLIATSTLSVVYNGGDIAGADESWPPAVSCPCAYPLTKAMAEREVLAADSPALRTIALRPHLIFGAGDPHLVPRVLARARAGRLRIVGRGRNRVDLVHVENVVDAHLLAELALSKSQDSSAEFPKVPAAGGKAYFITNGEPVLLWDWINDLLRALGIPPVTRHVPLGLAGALAGFGELLWRALPLAGEPPMTRFVAHELATDHWADISAARRDLGYSPRISMAAGTAELIASLQLSTAGSAASPPRTA